MKKFLISYQTIIDGGLCFGDQVQEVTRSDGGRVEITEYDLDGIRENITEALKDQKDLKAKSIGKIVILNIVEFPL